MSATDQICISLHGFNERSASRMRTVFLVNFRDKCVVSSEEEAHIKIIDFEGMNTEIGLIKERFSASNTLILSDLQKKIEDYSVIKKPADLGELWHSIIHAKAGVSVASSQASMIDVSGSTGVPENCDPLNAGKIGNEVELSVKLNTFDPKKYFVSYVQELIETNKQYNNEPYCIKIECWNAGVIYIVPNMGKVYTDLAKGIYRGLASYTPSHDFKTQAKATVYSWIPTERDLRKMESIEMDRFIWELAYRSSKGRVPHNIENDTLVNLHSWPNFTRLPNVPNGMRIAALWAGNPQRLEDIAKRLGIDRGEVNDFYFASHILGISGPTLQQSYAQDAVRSSKKNRAGILGAILKHVGKTFNRIQDEVAIA